MCDFYCPLMPFRTAPHGGEPAPGITHLVITGTDGRDHLVVESALASSPDGRYPARCGVLVAGAAMSTPPGRRCALCGHA
jgi:hypothetical protein